MTLLKLGSDRNDVKRVKIQVFKGSVQDRLVDHELLVFAHHGSSNLDQFIYSDSRHYHYDASLLLGIMCQPLSRKSAAERYPPVPVASTKAVSF